MIEVTRTWRGSPYIQLPSSTQYSMGSPIDYSSITPPYQPLLSESQPLRVPTRASLIDRPTNGDSAAACEKGTKNNNREVSLPPLIPLPLPLHSFCRRSTYFPFGRSTPITFISPARSDLSDQCHNAGARCLTLSSWTPTHSLTSTTDSH